MNGKCKVLHQTIGAASNKVISYIIEDDFGVKYEITPDRLISYVKTKSVDNVEIYNNSLLIFHGNSSTMQKFINYEFTDKVKTEINNYFNIWKLERDRELALNLKPDIEIDYFNSNNLFLLKNVIINRKTTLSIPSFITHIYDDNAYYKSKVVPMLSMEDYDKWTNSDVFVDKYTDCLLSEMLVGWHKSLILNGLITIIDNDNYMMSSVLRNENKSSIILDTDPAMVTLGGRTRYIKKSSFQYLCRSLHLNCNSNLRVLNLEKNMKQIKVSDLTLLVGKSDCSVEIVKAHNIKGKEELLKYKDYLSVYFNGYSNLSYTINDSGVILCFDNKETQLDALNLFKRLKDTFISTQRNTISISSKFKSGDSLYWDIKNLISERYDELSISYAFATVI